MSIVVDVQERFRIAMSDFDQIVAGCVRLVEMFRALERPIVVTVRYPKGLGHTVPELAESLGEKPGAVHGDLFQLVWERRGLLPTRRARFLKASCC